MKARSTPLPGTAVVLAALANKSFTMRLSVKPAPRSSRRGCYDSAPADRESAAFYEDLERKTGRGRAPLVPRRRRGQDPRATGDPDRGHAPRQGQAPVHAPRRHRRLRRGRERREDRRHRQEARRQDVLPPLGLPRRPEEPAAPRRARPPADRGAAQGGQGHAPAQPARPRADAQAEDLRRPRAPARGAGADRVGVEDLMSELATYRGTGKRKTSVARVILRPGDGTTWFNGREIEQYFPRLAHRNQVLAPLRVTGLEGTFDVRVRVHGGGPSGQAGAVRHGIARALVEADPELRVPLKRAGFLTRDARIVERKKAGLHKARKAPQFSKR